MLSTSPQKIEHYRLALLRLVAGLFVMAGLKPGTGVVERLPRRVRSAILVVLSQAESAARRLIFSEAQKLEAVDYVPRPKGNGSKSPDSKGKSEKTRAPRVPQFRLVDPRVFLEELYPHRKPRGSKPRRERCTEPRLLFRISNFDGQPPYEVWSEPDPEISPDDPLNAVPICRRMQALYHALSDLQKQAQRMAREIAKRRAAPPGPASVPPLRYGTPPGHRKRHIHEVDAILHECHCLAMREPPPPVGV